MCVSWYCRRSIDPITAPPGDVLNSFRSNSSWQTVPNSYRSAIWGHIMEHVWANTYGCQVPQRGVLESPSGPHGHSPEISRKLSAYSEYLFPAADTNLAMLLALADRYSETATLNVNRQYWQGNGIRFCIATLTKTRRGGPIFEAFYPAQGCVQSKF